MSHVKGMILVIQISQHSFYQSTLTVDFQLLAENERITILVTLSLKGCRSLGHYGTNCSISCPQNCLNGVCDINGYCPGCVAGYKGRTCNEGMYLDSKYYIIYSI